MDESEILFPALTFSIELRMLHLPTWSISWLACTTDIWLYVQSRIILFLWLYSFTFPPSEYIASLFKCHPFRSYPWFFFFSCVHFGQTPKHSQNLKKIPTSSSLSHQLFSSHLLWLPPNWSLYGISLFPQGILCTGAWNLENYNLIFKNIIRSNPKSFSELLHLTWSGSFSKLLLCGLPFLSYLFRDTGSLSGSFLRRQTHCHLWTLLLLPF